MVQNLFDQTCMTNTNIHNHLLKVMLIVEIAYTYYHSFYWTVINVLQFWFQVSAHYDADPYNMLSQLKKMNLKHVKVAYKSSKNKKDWCCWSCKKPPTT